MCVCVYLYIYISICFYIFIAPTNQVILSVACVLSIPGSHVRRHGNKSPVCPSSLSLSPRPVGR